jgi:hypothetical protein
MVEAEGLRDEFKGWGSEDRNRKVQRLAHVVTLARPFAVECSISRAKYDALVAPYAPYNLRSPYFFCFYGLIHSLARWHEEQKLRLPVDFIFDEHGSTGRDALLWYDYIRTSGSESYRKLLGGTPQFRDDKDILPLQAADMLAWHLRRRSSGDFLPRHKEALDQLLGPRHLAITLPDERLESLGKSFASVPGIHRVRDEKAWKKLAPLLERRLAAGLGAPSPWENFLQRIREPFASFAQTKGLRIARKLRRLFRIIGPWS